MNENFQSRWLSLTEYAHKYRVSISTLRRRIRSQSVQSRRVSGKYLLADEPLAENPTTDTEMILQSEAVVGISSVLLSEMYENLKVAYTELTQQRELQIVLLRAEISDLKTLITVLENENERLKHAQKTKYPLTKLAETLSY